MNAWQVAAVRPPHLAAICPWEGTSDQYREARRHGGILSAFMIDGSRTGSAKPSTGSASGRSATPSPESSPSATRPCPRRSCGPTTPIWSARSTSTPCSTATTPSGPRTWRRSRCRCSPPPTWGGQGLHLRGNTEGFLGAGSKQKWLRAARPRALDPLLHRLRPRAADALLRPLPQGRGQRLGRAAPGDPERPQGRRLDHAAPRGRLADSRTEWTKLYLDPAGGSLSREPPAEPSTRTYRPLEKGATFSRQVDRETEITGPIAAKLFLSSTTEDADIFLVLRVFDPDGEEVTFVGANEPAHAGLPGVAARFAPQARRGAQHPLSPVPRPRRAAAARAGRGLRARRRDLADLGPRTRRLLDRPHRAGPRLRARLRRRRDDRLVRPAEGIHSDPRDRPADVYGGKVTLHADDGRSPYLLLPVVPLRPGAGA